MADIAIFLADGFEEIEALTVVDLCRRAGLNIDMVSVMEGLSVTGSHGIEVKADKLLSDVKFDAMDMLVLPGGMPGTTNLEKTEKLMEQVRVFDAAGKYISAICAAPGVFGRAGLLNGRKACVFPGLEGELKGADVQMTETTVDGHILTSRGMGTAIPFGLAIVERFCGKEAADELGKKVVFRL
ncbi:MULTISPECIES: DJ-1 family glyoxalase III [unclassified Butyrivibrio]|uniref:DJ-1 family glyoxalase III n=1 Tax=unclassified Butyrivibrio TaxID=2639466 RepID=UPI0003B3A557|nr:MULTISPECIES: DJ-1 family glyoxalase III [unclassified Butyrivibrio]SEK62511.1 4-methyl-5(b-hydroxyethyl)-thiazole monophosphate biosynthesis [Butyrivibrio sp. ob235]